MNSKEKKSKFLRIILVIIILLLIFFLLIFSNTKNTTKEAGNNIESKEEIKDEPNIDYTISEEGIIKLNISSDIGIDHVIFPNEQIEYYNNEKVIEIHFTITENTEYLFIICESNGKQTEKTIVINDNSQKDDIGNSPNQQEEKPNVNTSNSTTSNSNNNNSNNSSNISNSNKNNNGNKSNINSNNNKNSNNNNNSNSNNNNNNNNSNSNNNNSQIQDKTLGTIYFNKPVGWTDAYLYITSNNKVVSKAWPGNLGKLVDDNTYAFNITESMGNIDNLKLQFNNGRIFKSPQISFQGYNKLYNFTLGALNSGDGTLEVIDYKENTITKGGPVNTNQITNVIFMIGDGMGPNHIKAAQIYSGNSLTIQSSAFYNTYVSTYSKNDFVTDSAASGTALATGVKTINYYIGINDRGAKLETLVEYAHRKGLKTGLVVTQVITHATPASFTAHEYYRYNYNSIAEDQIHSGINLMLGGGSNYFNDSTIQSLMKSNNYTYITNFSDINKYDKDVKIIGAFAPDSFHESSANVPRLSEMTQVALERLGSSNSCFFLMIEGSNIDTYSHNNDLQNMIGEMLEFDNAISVAKKYVDNHPNTLLVITADHETGGLNLNGATNRSSLLNQAKFTSSPSSSKQHTAAFVKVYTYGKSASGLTKPNLIDNTYIHNYIKQGLINKYGK